MNFHVVCCMINSNANQHRREDTPVTLPPAKVREANLAVVPRPTRFSPAAKEDWASTPETVRAEVLRLEKELTAGLKRRQAAAARDADLADFHDRAAKGGTTLRQALCRYVGLEDLLRTDPEKGLEAIFQNIGISPCEWAAKLIGQREESTAEAVEKFAAAHPRFEELSEDICFFIESGRADDLAEAYNLAERFNLAPSEADPVDGERAN
jgi:hypothetical protein